MSPVKIPRLFQYFSSESFNEANSATDLLPKPANKPRKSRSDVAAHEEDEEDPTDFDGLEDFDFNQKFVGDDPNVIASFKFKQRKELGRNADAVDAIRAATPGELRAEKRKKERCRHMICTIGFLVIVIVLGALLGVVLKPAPSAASNGGGTTPVANPTSGPQMSTGAPTSVIIRPCETQRMEPFPTSVPQANWSVPAMLMDLCENYPNLDCFSKGPMASAGMSGATLVDGTWYFDDATTVRMVRWGERTIVRLEVRHAHDPFQDSRAFVYSFTIGILQNCLESFMFYELNEFDQVRQRCSSSFADASNHSEVVARFIAHPTQFIDRSGSTWVFGTPASTSNIRTTDVDGQPDFLVGFEDDSTTIPLFLVQQRASHPLDSLLAADAFNLNSSCPSGFSSWTDQFFQPLTSRAFVSASIGDAGLASNEACSADCLKNIGGSLTLISQCITACLAQQELDSGGAIRRRMLANGAQAAEDTSDPFTGQDIAPIVFQSSQLLLQDTLTAKLALNDEDEDIRTCLLGKNSSNKSLLQTPKWNVKTLLETLTGLLQQANRISSRLEELESLAVQAYNFVLVHAQNAIDVFNLWDSLRTQVYADLQRIKLFADTQDNIQKASDLLNTINQAMDDSFQQWQRFFMSANWTGSKADEDSLVQTVQTIHQARLQMVQLSLVLDRYMIPVIQSKGYMADINSAAWQAIGPVQQALQLYSKLDFIIPDSLSSAIAVAMTDEALLQLDSFADDIDPVLQYLQYARNKLQAAMNGQVSQDIQLAVLADLAITVTDMCNITAKCWKGNCRSVAPTIVQQFSSSANGDCNAEQSTCVAPTDVQQTGSGSETCATNLFIPRVVRETRAVAVRDALIAFGLRNDQVEAYLNFALDGWGMLPPVPGVVPPTASSNWTAVLLMLTDRFQTLALPSSPSDGGIHCLFDEFNETVLLCPPFDGVTAALTRYCNLAGGATCEIDANCASGRCTNSTCCALGHQLCSRTCTAPNGFCLTDQPSASPSRVPTISPTQHPVTAAPSRIPSSSPIQRQKSTPKPSGATTSFPTKAPSSGDVHKPPVTSSPSTSPTIALPVPSATPTVWTGRPTKAPTIRTSAPTTMTPTKKNSPTKKPTNAPSALPTSSPSLGPTNLPTQAPIVTATPTNLPTTAPTLRPTLAPVLALCQRPKTTCEAIQTADECALWTGCGWNSENNVCWTQDCSEFPCRIRHYTFIASATGLPGCRSGDATLCDRQRMRAFNALNLASDCAASFVSVKNGGAWMGKETSQPVLLASKSDIYVSATGSDGFGIGSRMFPFKSVARALIETRKLTPSGKAKIILLPGDPIRITNPITLSPADSGLSVVGESDPATGARPRITAQLSLTGSRWEDVGGGIIRTKLSDAVVSQVDLLSALFIDDEPAIRARYPNLNDPLGFSYGPSGPAVIKGWGRPPPAAPLGSRVSQVIVPADDPNVKYPSKSTPFNRYFLAFGGYCQHFDPPASYFCEPTHYAHGGCSYTLPGSVTWMRNPFGKVFTNVSTAFFHTMHWYGWGLWTFQVKSQTSSQIVFDHGGWQEARGDCGVGGGAWFMENVIELLDNPNEYFLDIQNKYLYYYPNLPNRNPMLRPSAKVELSSSVRRFMQVVGDSQANPVRNVIIRNIEFFGAYATHMDKFFAPSGGDWAIHRGGAVYLESVENAAVQDNFFVWCAGNALYLSGHIRNVQIERNDFNAIGSTAIALVGDPNFYSSTPWKITDYPQGVRIYNNVASNLGLIVKQSAGVFLSISKEIVVENNVFFNGPRGGIVINDGFGGGHLIRRNVVFQFVLETNDHGPFDTWDRQQFNEPLRKINVIEENLLLGTPAGPKGIDFDDGAFNWLSQNNVVVWGYQKFKGSYIFSRNNLILYPLASSCAFNTPQTRAPANWVWENNTCVSYRPPYAYNGAPSDLAPLCSTTNFQAKLNTYYYLGADTTWTMCGGQSLTWYTWKSKYGQDGGSVFSKAQPSINDMEAWVKQKTAWIQQLLKS